VKALDLPPIDALRELLAREPGLTAHDIEPRAESDPKEEENGNQGSLPIFPVRIVPISKPGKRR